ncbi:MAG: acyl-CoA dehydrogenase family protein [Methylobacteriaceae bacterium]|nr:acyl-CoA dehydrogenase family protein [Methylobacteriaceae bacterium]
MDFTLPPELEDIRARTRAFVAEHVMPLEADAESYDAHENIRIDLMKEMQKKAREAGLWSPQAPKESGGMGLPVIGWAAMYEEANRSIFGPVCFNCAAPDDGNMNLLAKMGTPAQKERWLRPIVEGRARSAFVMTEPHPGGGSDPGMIRTRAERRGTSGWRVSGHKWFITGAGVAEHFVLIARTSDDPRRGLTAFLFHRDQPGWEIVRRIEIMGPEEHGGHCELVFDGLEIDDENVLGAVGDGLRATQTRLGPARLTHCMRWLGLSKRCMEIAVAYANERTGFGVRLADRESTQMKLGKLAAAIQTGRLLVMHAAWKIDRGDKAQKEVSMAKIHCADTLHMAADVGIQINGARGYSKDTVLEWIYRYARQARLVDGASEVHEMVLARAFAKDGVDFWRWG